MFITFIRDDQKKFFLGGSYTDTAAWGIMSVEGFGTVETELTTEKNAVGDGDSVTGVRVPARVIDIVANVKNHDNNETERRAAMGFFNPKHNFLVYIIRGEETRWIAARVERYQCPDTGADKNAQMNLTLKCVDPYFNSNDNFGKNIAATAPGFGFPFISSIKKGFNVGVYNFAKQVQVENGGDVETYFTIHIEAFGEVRNPKIINGQAYIRVLDKMQSGDKIDIDLVGNTIKKNGTNCIGKVDRTSSFSGMELKVGNNIVSFTADDGDTNMKVVLYYNLRYLGA